MITTGAKLYFGLAALALMGATVYGWGSRGGLNGVVTFGLMGGLGEHTGFVVLVAVGLVSLLVGGAVIAFRDADSDALAQVAQAEQAPEVELPTTNSYWPALGAVAAGLVVIGLVVNTQLFLLGAIVGAIVVIEWMVSAWSERATGDPVANRRIRNRIMYPLEIPTFSALGIAAVVLSVSRVLLALPKSGSAIAAIVVAVLILATASLLAASPKAGRSVVALLCVLGAIGVVAGGVIAAAKGERRFGESEPAQEPFRPVDRTSPVTAPPAYGGNPVKLGSSATEAPNGTEAN